MKQPSQVQGIFNLPVVACFAGIAFPWLQKWAIFDHDSFSPLHLQGFEFKIWISFKKGPLFSPDRERLLYNEQNELTSAAKEIHCPKTRHYSQIENALCIERRFQVTLPSPFMSLSHHESENGIISPALASGTTCAPISCRSLPGGRDFSLIDLVFSHILGLY